MTTRSGQYSVGTGAPSGRTVVPQENPLGEQASHAGALEVPGTWTGLDPVRNGGSELWSCSVSVPKLDQYDIVVGRGVIGSWATRLCSQIVDARNRAWIVTDANVWRLHGSALQAADGANELIADVLVLEPGEPTKCIDQWRRVVDWLASTGPALRRDALVAFGGSVITDLVGFAASTYMRGIPYVNISTTLLAQVDGAMGGKVAVNTAYAKNFIGAFHHPASVISDPELLVTLPREELANGMAEVIKTVVIESCDAFEYVSRNVERCLAADPDVLTTVVRLCTSIKMHLLRDDPYEVDLRRVLNLGHSMAHPIETAKGYEGIRHGEAVALGIATALRIGVARGLTSPATSQRVIQLLERSELPTRVQERLLPAILDRVHVIYAIRNGSLRFVIPANVSRMVIVTDVTEEELVRGLLGVDDETVSSRPV